MSAEPDEDMLEMLIRSTLGEVGRAGRGGLAALIAGIISGRSNDKTIENTCSVEVWELAEPAFKEAGVSASVVSVDAEEGEVRYSFPESDLDAHNVILRNILESKMGLSEAEIVERLSAVETAELDLTADSPDIAELAQKLAEKGVAFGCSVDAEGFAVFSLRGDSFERIAASVHEVAGVSYSPQDLMPPAEQAVTPDAYAAISSKAISRGDLSWSINHPAEKKRPDKANQKAASPQIASPDSDYVLSFQIRAREIDEYLAILKDIEEDELTCPDIREEVVQLRDRVSATKKGMTRKESLGRVLKRAEESSRARESARNSGQSPERNAEKNISRNFKR